MSSGFWNKSEKYIRTTGRTHERWKGSQISGKFDEVLVLKLRTVNEDRNFHILWSSNYSRGSWIFLSFYSQKTTRNWGAPELLLAGRVSHRQGSSWSDTGQKSARVTLSAVAATDPNSNTVTMAGRGTSVAPFMPGSSAAAGGLGVGLVDLGSEWGFEEPLNQERRPMVESDLRVGLLRQFWVLSLMAMIMPPPVKMNFGQEPMDREIIWNDPYTLKKEMTWTLVYFCSLLLGG